MYRFGRRSSREIATLNTDWRPVLHKAIRLMDFSVLQGTRSKEEQNELFAKGLSKVQYPNSKHNTVPSLAVDLAPYPIDWNDHIAFAHLAGIIRSCAMDFGHGIRWGGDWDSDGESNDQTFMDIGHFELVRDLYRAD